MTTPSPYPQGIDPVHVQIVAATVSTVERADGSVLLLAIPGTIRVHLPNRSATRAARDALERVGYQVTSSAGSLRNRGLLVVGWSAQGLESRLDAMRGVLQKLVARPDATAALALGQLSRVPAAELPGRAGQQRIVGQLSTGLRSWISATSGIHAASDPRARPADPGCALRLSATRRAEQAIDDLVERQTRVAEFAVALYPSLRQTMSHDAARDCALRWAGIAFHLIPQADPDLSPLLRGSALTGDPVPAPADAQPASPAPRPLTGMRRKPPSVGEFPAGVPISRASRPPSVTGTTSPRGRNSSPHRNSRRH